MTLPNQVSSATSAHAAATPTPVSAGVGFYDSQKGKAMDYFTPIPEAQAIVCANGVYRQVPVAERAGRAYAKYGAGYVRLHQGGGTSHQKVRWYEIDPGDWAFKEEKGAVLIEALPQGRIGVVK